MAASRAFGSQLLVVAALCSSAASQTSTVTQTPPHDDNGTVYYDGAENVWITEDDRQVAQWANDAVIRWCAGGYKGDLAKLSRAREAVENAVGDNNLLMTVLEENATSREDIQNIMLDNLPHVAMVMLPFLLIIVTAIVWLGCCSSACCACCRCCARKRSKSAVRSIAQVIVITLCFLAVVVIYLGVDSSHGQIVDGVDNMLCSSAKLLNTSLNGEGSPMGFIGMMPVLQKFFWLEQQMKTDSPLLLEFNQILDRTAGIEDSIVLVADEIRLLSDMLNEPRNMYPATQSGDTLYHTCQFCKTLGPVVEEISKGLEEGVGNALNKARAEVQSQLSYSKRKELQAAATSAAAPLRDAKDQMTGFLKVLVDPDAITDGQKKQIVFALWLAFLLVSAVALLLVLCGCCSTACCICRFEHNNHPSSLAPRCACVVWCCSFQVLFMVLLTTGLLNVIIAPSTQICGFMAGLDSNVLVSIAEASNVNMSTDNFVMAKSLVDVCWTGDEEANGGSNLLDLLFMRRDDGSKQTMRQKLVGDVTTPIDAAFDNITSRVNLGNITLGSSAAFAQLKDLLATMEVKSTLTVSEQYVPTGFAPPAGGWADDATYGGLFKDLLTSSAVFTSTACSNYTDATAGLTIPGMIDFADRLQQLPGATPLPTTDSCITKVDCSGVSNSNAPCDVRLGHTCQRDACDAGNAFLELKLQLLNGEPAGSKSFQCNVFRTSGGASCDPHSMVRTGDGSYTGDCLRTHEAGYTFTEQDNVSCSLDEFQTYLQEFSTRLDKAIERLDNVTVEVFNITLVDLRSLVDRYFVDQIDEVANGISCGFLPKIKDTVIDSLCFQGLAGFKTIANMYLITALLIIVLAIDMYVLFRVMIDNVSLYAKDGVVDQII